MEEEKLHMEEQEQLNLVFPPLVFPSTLWTYLGCEMSSGQPQRQCTSLDPGSAAVVARVAVPPTAKQPSLGSGLAFIKPYRRRRRRADNHFGSME
ncbi:hypothetical protein QOT17_009152 [Balamuthia mandrillaris]